MTKASKKLLAEAARFEALAMSAAVSMVRAFDADKNPDMPFAPQAHTFRKLATSHLLRAETYRAAAALVSNS